MLVRPNGFAVLLRASLVPLRVRCKASPPLRPSCDRQQQPLVRTRPPARSRSTGQLPIDLRNQNFNLIAPPKIRSADGAPPRGKSYHSALKCRVAQDSGDI